MKKKENEPEIDESLLTEAQKEEMKKGPFSWGTLIFFLVVIGLIAICGIVVACL